MGERDLGAPRRMRPQPMLTTADEMEHFLERIRRHHRPAFIYFFKCGDRVKIGLARDVKERRDRISSFCPYPLEILAVMPGTRADEMALHQRFASFRTHGEWFHCQGGLADYIAGLAT